MFGQETRWNWDTHKHTHCKMKFEMEFETKFFHLIHCKSILDFVSSLLFKKIKICDKFRDGIFFVSNSVSNFLMKKKYKQILQRIKRQKFWSRIFFPNLKEFKDMICNELTTKAGDEIFLFQISSLNYF